MTPEELQARVDAVPLWHHSIELGGGVRTPGFSEATIPTEQLPELAGRTVLDIGAWDGYYSFLAERAGASRVVALDHYAWGVDFHARNAYWRECTEASVLPDHDRDLTDFWRPDLPGRAGFELAREALGSRVEAVLGDIATMDVSTLGRFDVVLFLGVLYHVQEPLSTLRRVRQVTGEVAVIETEAVDLGDDHLGDDGALMKFCAAGMGAGYDYGIWYVPTIAALKDLCRAAGFASVEVVQGPPPPPSPSRGRASWARRLGRPRLDAGRRFPSRHYRAIVHTRP
jgi:tRNA (mo5U34)-methyltransferase